MSEEEQVEVVHEAPAEEGTFCFSVLSFHQFLLSLCLFALT
jgi:hypothetical protein